MSPEVAIPLLVSAYAVGLGLGVFAQLTKGGRS